jgi:hypothetical protein
MDRFLVGAGVIAAGKSPRRIEGVYNWFELSHIIHLAQGELK